MLEGFRGQVFQSGKLHPRFVGMSREALRFLGCGSDFKGDWRQCC